MATPKAGYFIDNERIPGTTTIISRFTDSGGLLQWAFKQGQSGVSRLYEKSDEACDIGTEAHSMIEARLNGEVLEATRPEAQQAFDNYLRWERQTKLELLSKYQEIQLVSPEFKFGGTPDAIGRIDGEIFLLDWKTSNGCYSDYLIQLAAYIHLVNEGVRMDTGEPLPFKVSKGTHLLRFAKNTPDFAHHFYGDLDLAWEQFKLLRAAFDNDKILRKRV